MTWHFDATALRSLFERDGYDVDTSNACCSGDGGSLTARRDRGDEVRLITIDAGGRVKIMMTRLTEESGPRTTVLAGVTLRGVTETTTVHTLTGKVISEDQLLAIIGALDSLPRRLAGLAQRR